MSNTTTLLQKIDQLDGLTTDEKAQLKNLLNTQKKYGLVWEDKPEEVERQLLENLPVLVEVKERYIAASQPDPVEKSPNKKGISEAQLSLGLETAAENPENQINPENHGSDNGPAPHHILIEGDNLHALTALSFTHKEKIDVIYIDPPYNTGKENEFRYNDRWVLKDDPFRHSLWLSFIKKRLVLAKQLLSDRGVMIIHIDENEFDALNLLLETEIFDRSNSLGQIIWNKLNPKGEVAGVATMHEYVLIYAKSKETFKALENILERSKPNALTILKKAKTLFGRLGKKQIPDSIKEVIKPFNYPKDILKDFEVIYDLELINSEFQNWIAAQDFSGGEKAYKFIDENGEVYQSVSMAAPDKPETRSHRPLIHPSTMKPCPVPAKGWRNPDITMDDLLDKGLILFGDDETTQPRRKYLLKENLSEVTPSIYNNGSSDEVLFKELNLNFPFPKVTSASKYFLKNIHPNPKIILDFFAGSGTTLHATMQLNAEDGGSRQCILVTNNENKIAEEVCYERNKRVINGYTKPNGEKVPGLKNNHLHYYKAAFVPAQRNQVNRRQIVDVATEIICIRESAFSEVSRKYALDTAFIRLFQADSGQFTLVLYYHRFMDEAVAKAIELVKQLSVESGPIKIYAFAPQGERYEEEFETVKDKITVVPLPEAIYNAYQSSLRRINVKRYQNPGYTDAASGIPSDLPEIDFKAPSND